MTTRFSSFALIIGASLLLTSCFSGPQGQSSLIPKNSVVVTTSPSIAIAPCQTLSIDAFTAPDTFSSGKKPYTLLGVRPESTGDTKQEQDLYTFLKQKGFCTKQDPSIDDERSVYLFTSENGLINGEVIRRGLATADRNGDYIYKEYLINLEKEAQANAVGIWKDPARVAAAKNAPQDSRVAEDSSSYVLIFPQDAAQHHGDTVTLRMTVGSTGKSNTALYLNSEADYTSEANVAVLLASPTSAEGRALEKRMNTLEGKTVDATGRITVTSGRAQMQISRDADVIVNE